MSTSHPGRVSRDRAPEPASPRPYSFPEVERFTLDNGLRVVVASRSTAPIVSVRVVFEGGGEREPIEKPGLAGLTAEMLDEGAAGQTGLEIAEAVGDLGAYLATGADWDAAYAYVDVLGEQLADGVAILADVVRRPDFRAEDVERVRRERLTEILQQRDEPSTVASIRFSRFIYGESVYGNPLSGTVDSVRSMTRDDLVAFYRRHYAPNHATLIFAGNVPVESARELATRHFGSWEKGEDLEPLDLSATRPEHAQIYVIDRPEAVQSEIRVGHVGVARSCEDYFPLTTMNALLGGIFTSRLNLNLREKHGFTYGIRSAFSFRRHAGPFVVTTAVRNAVTADAAREILSELRRLRSGDVTDEELHETKSYLTGVFPATVQSANDLANRLQEMALYHLPDDYFDHYRANIDGVTKEDIARVASKYLDPDNAAIVVVGKATEISEALETLGHPIGLYDVEGKHLV
jgi:zinc protease